MNETLDRKASVVCLFCGLQTPVGPDWIAHASRASIIRCESCGKEAPYYPSEVIQMDRKARAVGQS